MRDFVSVELRTSLSQVEVHERLVSLLPQFSFRMGDSDANGPYISGTDESKTQLKVWLGEDPATLTLSTRGWKADETSREEAKQMLWDRVTGEVLPVLGQVVRIVDGD